MKSNDFGLKVSSFKNEDATLKEISENKFQIIYASAEQALSAEFLAILRDESSMLKQNLSLVVVDECHTVDTW
jgi:superfamily II DNA helicase RecQ